MYLTARNRILAYREASKQAQGNEDAFIKGAKWAFYMVRRTKNIQKILDEIELTDKAFAEVQKRLNNG